MVRTIFLLCLGILPWSGNAQNEISHIRKGLLRGTATFTPGVNVSHNYNNVYVHCDLSYYFVNKVSMRSDVYLNVMSFNEEKEFKHYYSVFTGAAYHVPVRNIDFLFSLQPGIGIMQTNEHFNNDGLSSEAKLQLLPMLGIGAGVNFFIHKNFHFMTHVKFVKGTYTGGLRPVKINEFLFSAGLGWNVNFSKKRY